MTDINPQEEPELIEEKAVEQPIEAPVEGTEEPPPAQKEQT